MPHGGGGGAFRQTEKLLTDRLRAQNYLEEKNGTESVKSINFSGLAVIYKYSSTGLDSYDYIKT